MNNKGMTVIELITSFVLASIVFIILFNVILSLKDVYVDNGLKTKLLIEQANLSRSLNKEINSSKTIISINKSVDEQSLNYTFTYSDGTSKTLIINDGEITFDGFTYELEDNITSKGIDNDYISVKPLSTFNLLIIDIPVESSSVSGNYGVKVVYRFTDNIELNL